MKRRPHHSYVSMRFILLLILLFRVMVLKYRVSPVPSAGDQLRLCNVELW